MLKLSSPLSFLKKVTTSLIKVLLEFILLNIPLERYSFIAKYALALVLASASLAAIIRLKHLLWNACQIFLPKPTITMQWGMSDLSSEYTSAKPAGNTLQILDLLFSLQL